jgi:heme-degrading monooxygenase HmoA
MYVRITRGRFQPERIDDVEAMASDVADAIKILPGFLGYSRRS